MSSVILRARVAAVLGVFATVALLLLLGTPASATIVGHSYDFSFGGSGANALSSVPGIAVDNSSGPSSGSVYVGDATNARIEKFDAAGNFLLMFGKGVNQTSGGDVCPRPGFPADVCQAGTAGAAAGQFTNPKYIAVDWTGGSSAGDVYVLDPTTQIIQKFAPDGTLITSWGGPPDGPAGGQLNGSGIPIFGAWTNAQGIAVGPDSTLNVMTLGGGSTRLFTFDEDATYERSLLLYQSPKPTGLAMDTLGNFLAGGPNGNGGEYKFRGSDGQAIAGDFSSQIQGGYEVQARTVDVSPDPRRTDDYYLVTYTTVNQAHWQQPNKWLQADGSYCYAYGFGSCHPTTTFGPPNLSAATGVAVSNSGTVYVTDATPKKVVVFKPTITPDVTNLNASNVDVSTATINGDVGLAGGGNVTDCYFEWGRSNTYEKAPVPCSPAASVGSPFTTDQAVHADLTNLLPNSLYHFRLVATNAQGPQKSDDATFTTTGPPGIEAFSTSNLTASSVDLNAKINPHGADTTYVFKYGTSTAYGTTVPAPPGSIPSGFTAQDVSVHVDVEDATYHFQVVATNKYGTVTSDDQVFSFHPEVCPNQTVRQQTGAAYLPDCRAYELVSPADTGSAFLFSGGPQRPYADPPRFAFTADYGDIPGTGGQPINTTGDLYVATRGGNGWTTKFVGVPGSISGCAGGRPLFAGAGLASTVQNDVKADRNLTRIVDWQLGNPTQCVWDTIGLSLRVTDNNTTAHASMAPWVWNTSDGSYVDRLPTSVADVPGSEENFKCHQEQGESADAECSTAVELSGDLTHFVFSTQKDIYNGGPDALSAAPGSAYDNDTVNNTLSLISVLPGTGGPITQESFPNGGPNEVIQFPAVSEDGSHILMGTLKNPQCRQFEYPAFHTEQCPQVSNPTHLYMRVNDAVTYEIAPVPVTYIDSTPDTRKVYFTTAQALTGEDTDSNLDLYMWSDLGGPPSLTLVSQGSAGGNGSTCGAKWISGCSIETYKDEQISASASNKGGLSPNWFAPGGYGMEAAPGNTGTKGFTDNAVAIDSGDIVFYSPEDLDGTGIRGAVNVYLYREGATQLVATLDDMPYCIGDDAFEQSDIRPERCSDGPLGRVQITPDGRYVAFITTTQLTPYNNLGHAEMYRYDAETRNILCISCRPDGQPPTSDVLGSYDGRFISDDGRVFFTTNEEIDPRDSNTSKDVLTGKTLGADVYEYSGGVPKLITTGTGQQAGGLGLAAEAWPGLLGVSADGMDVYFLWPEPLAGQDLNGLNNYRVYDARTNGGFPYNPPAPLCRAADECHDIPSQPATSLFSGTSAGLGTGGNAQSKAKKKKHKARHRRHRRSHRKGAGRRGRAHHNNVGGAR